jgi:ribosomal protein L11 methylase PrmA
MKSTIAEQHADGILERTRAFMTSRIILSAAELGIFTRLARKPDSADSLAEKLGADKKALTRLLDALVANELMDKQNGVYQSTHQAARLSADHPETVLPMVLHMAEVWNSWSKLTEVVQKGQKRDLVAMTDKGPGPLAAFIGAMHVAGRQMAAEFASDQDLQPYRKLLDIGGASGTYTIAFLKQAPGLSAVIFDLPRVIPMAEARLREENMEHRAEVRAGDYNTDAMPQGCDLALLSAIIHQNSPEQNRSLYARICQALEPGGALLIRDHIMEEDRTRPPGGAVFALNMLVNTRGGDTYTFSEVRADLLQAGFSDVHMVRTGRNMDCVVQAVKPS